jgi:RNA polymerase sigma-70 factor (ECF subfamily)
VGPDVLLVWRLRQGDRDACVELIRRHHQKVYGYLRWLGADSPLAEDLTQETYAKAWAHLEALHEAASLRSWLLAIARNEYLQWCRAKRADEQTIANPPDCPDESPSAEESVSRAERDQRLWHAVAQLEADSQETLALHYFQELSLREVGAVLGLPTGTVKSRLSRALESLRSVLTKGDGS